MWKGLGICHCTGMQEKPSDFITTFALSSDDKLDEILGSINKDLMLSVKVGELTPVLSGLPLV